MASLTTKLYVRALGASLTAVVLTAGAADWALSRLPFYDQIKVQVLDSIFGPEEPFEFTGPTSPPYL